VFYAGDGSMYQNQKEIKHKYSKDGIYIAVAEAENEFGCIGTDTLIIEVFPEINIYVPNIFSPNGDGTNETFKVVATGLIDYRIDIYNQWGGKVFESTELNEGWDGIYGNEESPIGVYIYHIYATTIFEEKIARRGQLLLIR
jgi:gliding motility-associated-like protein